MTMGTARLARSQKGIALVTTLLVTAVLLLLGTALLSLSSTESQIALDGRNSLQAFYLAEAGVERAIAELNANASYAGTGGEVAFGAGTYTVTVTTPAGSTTQRVITATGCVPNCAAPGRNRRRIRMTAERVSPFRWPLFGDVSATLDQYVLTDSFNSATGAYGGSNIGLHGNVGSNGNISLKDGVAVKGDVVASGSVTKEGTVTISGQTVQGEKKTPLQAVDQFACNLANWYGYSYIVDKGRVSTLEGGTYFFKTMSVGGGAVVELKGPTTIYVGDQMQVKSVAIVGARPGAIPGDVRDKRTHQSAYEDPTPGELTSEAGEVTPISQSPLQPPPYLTIHVCGTSEVHLNDGSVLSGVLYAPNAVVRVRKRALVFGSIIGKQVYANTKARFHYDEALRGNQPGRFRPLAGTWQELLPVTSSSY